MLKLLLLGISTRKIRNILNIDYTLFKQVKESLKSKGRISEDRIKKALKEREERDKNTIYKFLKLGYSNVELIDKVPYGDRHYISKLVEGLKKEGKITDEQIEKYRFERNEKHKKEIILQGLNQGLSYKEIADNYNEKYTDRHLCEKNVGDYKNKLVERGDITEEVIQERRKARKEIKAKQEKEQHISPKEKIVFKLLNLGFTAKQIREITHLAPSSLWRVKKSLKEKGKITEEEIQYATSNRENQALERREHIVKMINFSKDIDEKVVQKHIDYAKVTLQLNELAPKDIKLLGKVIPMNPKLVSFDNANFILRALTKQNNDVQAVEFIDECLVACEEDKEKCAKLENAKAQIENKIIQLRKRDITVKNKVITMPQSSNNRSKNRN